MELGSDDEEGKGKAKSRKQRPVPKKNTTDSVSASGGVSFLTAAEQREQEKKNDKKASEDPYAFLSVIKDVSMLIFEPFAVFHLVDFCRKMD